MRRKLVLAAATAVMAGALYAAPGLAAPAPVPCTSYVRSQMRSGSIEVIALRSFNVELDSLKPAYRIGENAVLNATVTRPAKEDPLGLGQEWEPPVSEAAADVNVGVGLSIGDVFLFGHGVTNEEGKATIKIRIKSYTRPGTASVDGYAWKTQVDAPCARLEENGYERFPGLFKVVL